MNEKLLLKIFLTISLILVSAILAISVATQAASDKRTESVLLELQDGYGVMLSQLFKNDALNGNNRAVIEGLERLVSTSAIDGYIFQSFVSDFERSSTNENLADFFQSEIGINFSNSSSSAAKIIVLTRKDRLRNSKNDLVILNKIGWIVLLFLLVAGSVLVFVLLRRENGKIRGYIETYISNGNIDSSHDISPLWNPIIETIKTSKARVDHLNAQLEKARVSEAIARTTQMLAHDVRKPFNLFRMTIERVKSAKNPEQMSAILNEALPEVDRSLASVNGLIADVLNVGGETTLTLKPTRLASVVEEVIDELRKQYPGRALNIKLDVPPEIWVQADITRLPRVFMNIMSNAIEAIGTQNVRLWVNARTLANNDVEVLVGNEGSFIAADVRERIFDLFYTSGKTGGTGLGLAIVKKIATQHGGSVVCTSEMNDSFPLGKVEFKLTLKSASPIEEPVTTHSAVPETQRPTVSKSEDSETSATQEKPQVVFLDDSPLVRWVWEAKLKAHVNISCFDGPDSFFQTLRSGPTIQSVQISLDKIHTIITDHYFAPDARMTGVELASELRRMGFTGRILLASNGEFSPEELHGIVDKIVDKQPVEWELLKT